MFVAGGGTPGAIRQVLMLEMLGDGVADRELELGFDYDDITIRQTSGDLAHTDHHSNGGRATKGARAFDWTQNNKTYHEAATNTYRFSKMTGADATRVQLPALAHLHAYCLNHNLWGYAILAIGYAHPRP